MSYKYTFKQYIRDKLIELWEFIQSEPAFPIAFVSGTLGILIIDIILFRNFRDIEHFSVVVFYADMAWGIISVLIGAVGGHIAEDFRYEKRSKEREFKEKEEQCQAEDHQ